MKNILIPTDFSKNAWNAISYAMQFLENEKCKIYFLHTYTPAFYRLDYALGGTMFSAIPDVKVDVALAGLEKDIGRCPETISKRKSRSRNCFGFQYTDRRGQRTLQKK